MQAAINKAITTNLTKPMSEAMATEFDLDHDAVFAFVTEFLNAQLKSKGKAKTPTDPNKPKKTTGWLLFSAENRESVRAELGEEQDNVKMTDVTKRLAEMWKELDETEKQAYKDQATESNGAEAPATKVVPKKKPAGKAVPKKPVGKAAAKKPVKK